MFADLLSILRCPVCAAHDRGVLEHSGPDWFVCSDCSRRYPSTDEVAVMLVEQGDRWRDVPADQLPEDGPPSTEEELTAHGERG